MKVEPGNKNEWVTIASYHDNNVIRLTQNQNESLNSVVWSHSPKRFCGIFCSTISIM